MSYPFIIWTMQRTGGTALTELLMEMSEHKSAEHEPFNWARSKPRQFWPVAEAWQKTRNGSSLRRSLREIFGEKYLIKHCYELHAAEFNRHLIEVSVKTPYRQIMLLRRDEYSRLVSKFIAENQGTWFKDYAERVFSEVAEGRRMLGPLPTDKMVSHYQHCRAATDLIRAGFARLGVQLKEIYYEDLYSGDPELRMERVHELLDFLGFTAAQVAEHAALIDQKIFHSGQNTGAVAQHVPNLDRVREALAAVGCRSLVTDEPEPGAEVELSGPAAETQPCPIEKEDEMSIEGPVAQTSERTGPQGPRAKVRAELERLVEAHLPSGPVLEIAADIRDLATPAIGYFDSYERHVIGLGEDAERKGVTFHGGEPHDMSAFADGQFGVVISNRAMARDAKFLLTADEIRRVLAPGGLAIFVTPCFSKVPNDAGVVAVGRKGNPFAEVTVTYRIHSTPDYWRISPQAMKQVILDGYDIQEVKVKMMPPHVFGVGLKVA